MKLTMELDPNERRELKNVRVVVGPNCPSHEFMLVRTSDRDYVWIDTETGDEFAVGPKGKHLKHSHQSVAVDRLFVFYGEANVAWTTGLVQRLRYSCLA